MKIVIDDLTGPEIAAFLQEHIEDMRATSPPESKHALDLEGLRKPEIAFWSVYDEDKLIACGALKKLTNEHAEVKSMRTSSIARGKGVASKLLQHLLNEARAHGYQKLSLETGAMQFFAPARALYTKFGFEPCLPFSDYKEDPNSVFMQIAL